MRQAILIDCIMLLLQPTANYLINVSKLLASYGCVLSLHYLVVFILLVIIYFKLLKHIKKIRLDYGTSYL